MANVLPTTHRVQVEVLRNGVVVDSMSHAAGEIITTSASTAAELIARDLARLEPEGQRLNPTNVTLLFIRDGQVGNRYFTAGETVILDQRLACRAVGLGLADVVDGELLGPAGRSAHVQASQQPWLRRPDPRWPRDPDGYELVDVEVISANGVLISTKSYSNGRRHQHTEHYPPGAVVAGVDQYTAAKLVAGGLVHVVGKQKLQISPAKFLPATDQPRHQGHEAPKQPSPYVTCHIVRTQLNIGGRTYKQGELAPKIDRRLAERLAAGGHLELVEDADTNA